MNLVAAYVLDVCLLASEITLVLSRKAVQSDGERTNADSGSLRMLWIVIIMAMTAGHMLAMGGVGPYLRGNYWQWIGIGVFIVGLLYRRYSIRYLGRLFTVDVAVAQNHHVVDDGPYRHVRHPTYTGLLMMFAGIGVVLQSVTGFLVIMVPVLLIFLHRVRIEEAALMKGLGEPYAAYIRRTKRFVRGIY